MSKKISITGNIAREKALEGIEYVSKAITSTIGPNGLNFILEKGRKSSNDGYNIASELVGTIDDEYARLSAQMAHEASSKTNDTVGDATSTAWALTGALCREATRYLPKDKSIKAKKNPAQVRQMIESDMNFVISELVVTPINSKEELIKSALVSVEDERIAEILGSMQWDLGKDGRIIAEEVNETECSIEKVEGLMLDNGFTSSMLVTNPEKQSLELDEFPIFLTNYTIGDKEIVGLKESIINPLINQKKKGLILMARAFTPEAIKLCQESVAAGFAILPINAPYTDQREVMKDIEAVVGGRYIDTEESSLSDVYITDVGFTRRIVAKQYNSIITGMEDEQSKVRVAKRVETLQKKIIGSQSDFEKRAIEERISQLTGGFAILKVGSRSVVDRKRLKDKCDDAVNAVRHALKGGTVKGGGLAFKEISDKMTDENILKRPLLCVYEQIINSSPDDFVIEDWVRDPMIVLKTALENACAFAIAFSSTNGIITTSNVKECKCNETNQSS